jgi:large subunit ribosomal protein L29
MSKSEIKDLSTKDIVERIQTEKANYTRMKLEHAISPVENTSTLGAARKNIARMLTELRQRQINEKK